MYDKTAVVEESDDRHYCAEVIINLSAGWVLHIDAKIISHFLNVPCNIKSRSEFSNQGSKMLQ